MKIFKYLLFLTLIFIIGASIYIATKDGKFQVEESLMMDAPKEIIFNEVNDYTTWKNWEPWAKEADDMIINYGEKTTGEGANYSWKSNELGEGEMLTTKANPHSNLQQDITFKTAFGESNSEIYWNFETQGDSTLVTWGMMGEQSFMDKVAFIFEDKSLPKMMQPMFKSGLNSLEEEIKIKMNSYSINVEGITQHGGGYYMYITTASKISQISDRMEKMINEVGNFMSSNNIEQVGKPFILYNEWNQDQGTAIYSAAYFTPSEVVTTSESSILNGFMPNQRTLKTTLNGDYKNLEEARDLAYAYLQKNGLKTDEDANSFEVYLTGPKDNANPAEWITNIYIPLEQTIAETESND